MRDLVGAQRFDLGVAGQALPLQAEVLRLGARGSIVTLLCDGGERYRNTYKSDAWLAEQGLDLAPYSAARFG